MVWYVDVTQNDKKRELISTSDNHYKIYGSGKIKYTYN